MNEELLIQIDRKIADHFAEVAKLQAARKALAGSNGTAAKQNGAPAAAKKAKAKAKRAPAGFLETAMQKAIKERPGLTNGEVRAALVKGGYPFSLSPLHVGKRLSALVDAKRLAVKLDGHQRRYHPAK